jgi:hypothetical protein
MDRRYIYSSASSSESLDRVSAEAERLFWRLIPHADDYGRFDARPKVIRGNCFPLAVERIAPDEVDRWIGELVVAESLAPYEVRGRPYAVFVNWFRFQPKPPRFSKPMYPDPPPAIAELVHANASPASSAPETPNTARSTSRLRSRAGARGREGLELVLDLEPGLASPTPTPPSPAAASNGHARRTPRPSDPVFETLCDIEGVDPGRANDAERSKLGRARKLAGQGEWEPADIRAAADRWPAVMGSATRSALGVMSNIQRLLNGPSRADASRRRDRAQEIAEQALVRHTEEVTRGADLGGGGAGRLAAGVLPGA